jgi:hypothetical protein
LRELVAVIEPHDGAGEVEEDHQSGKPDGFFRHDRGRETASRVGILERERNALGDVARDAPGEYVSEKTPIQLY